MGHKESGADRELMVFNIVLSLKGVTRAVYPAAVEAEYCSTLIPVTNPNPYQRVLGDKIC